MTLTFDEWKRARELYIDEVMATMQREEISRSQCIYLLGKSVTLLTDSAVDHIR